MKALREENRRLRDQAAGRMSVDNASPSTPTGAIIDQGTGASDDPDTSHTPVATVDSLRAYSASIETPASIGGNSTYHGPTSTLFDDAGRTATQTKSWFSKEREIWMPKLLVAAAAEQRQLESINARAGKLDFDGVDPELGLHLLNLHWNRQHHSFLITYRPAFMRLVYAGTLWT